MSEGTPPVQFRAGLLLPALTARVEPGASLGQVASRDLARIYALMTAELRRLDLAEPEAMALSAVSMSTWWEPASIPYLWAEVEDARALGELPACDVEALVRLLRAVGPLGSLTIVDALERARLLGDAVPIGDRLRAVGLVRG